MAEIADSVLRVIATLLAWITPKPLEPVFTQWSISFKESTGRWVFPSFWMLVVLAFIVASFFILKVAVRLYIDKVLGLEPPKVKTR